MNTLKQISRDRADRPDVLLYACVGGHLDQLIGIAESLSNYKLHFVVNDFHAARPIMESRTSRITFAERDLRQLINIWEILVLLFSKRPKVIISTGSAPAVWFFYLGRLFGAKLIFIESIARVKSLSLTGKLVKPVADHFFVQWTDLAKSTGAEYAGMIKGGRA